MGGYLEKYIFKEGSKTEKLHRSRRIFCIREGKLHIAKPNFPYSHAIWFEMEGWISKNDDKFMDETVRGMIDEKKDIYFYKGYDFKTSENVENIFFPLLEEIVTKLSLGLEGKIFSGFVKKASKIVPIKYHGIIRDNLLNHLKDSL